MVFPEGTIEDLDTLDDEVMWLHYYSGCETDPRLLGERTLRVTYLDLVDTVLGTGATVAPEETPSVLLSALLYQHLGVPLLKFRALGVDRCPVPGFIHWCQNDYFFCAHDAWFEGNRPMLETHW